MCKRIILILILLVSIIYSSLSFKICDLNKQKNISVEIKGEVKQEKVLSVPLGTKLGEIIDNSILKTTADTSKLSMLKVLKNNEIIVVPKKDDRKLISINSADILQLQNIPGIGEKTAQKIIDYRSSNGCFYSIEELKEVNGIGDKKFESIKEYICL